MVIYLCVTKTARVIVDNADLTKPKFKPTVDIAHLFDYSS